MSFLSNTWLKTLDKIEAKSNLTYYILAWLFAIIGFGYVYMFPVVCVYLIFYVISILSSSNPLEWQFDHWIPILIAVPIIIYTGWVSFVLLKIKPDQPTGKPLTEEEFPNLFEYINEYIETFHSPKIHQVKLSPDNDIHIIRTPVCGYPFKFKNTLMVGLATLCSFSETHFKALLARQIGHFSYSRTQLSRHLVFFRDVFNIYKNVYKHGWKPETILLRLFFGWYASFYNKTTIALLRHENYLKDTAALEIAPSETITEAIAVSIIKNDYLENEFWPDLENASYRMENPPYHPYQSMSEHIMRDLGQEVIENRIKKLLSESAETVNVAPGLLVPGMKERLHNLGYDDFIPKGNHLDTTAINLLGNQAQTIIKQMDNIWLLKNKKSWGIRYKTGIEEKKQLQSLTQQSNQGTLDEKEISLFLTLIKKYLAHDEAIPLYKNIIKHNNPGSHVAFKLGKILIRENDPLGVKALQQAMDISPEYTVESCNHIVEYMVKHGDNAQAQNYRRMILEFNSEA